MARTFLWPIASVLTFALAFFLAVSRGLTIAAIVIGVFGLLQVFVLGMVLYAWRRGSIE